MGKGGKAQPAAVAAVPDDELRFRLGIKPGHKICLFHAPKYLLPLFLAGDLKLTLDWVESDSDVVVYWLRSEDDAVHVMTNLERMIKRDGRIWLIVPKKGIARQHDFVGEWEDIRRAVLEATSLVDNKAFCLNDTEYGTQFMSRKAARAEARTEYLP